MEKGHIIAIIDLGARLHRTGTRKLVDNILRDNCLYVACQTEENPPTFCNTTAKITPSSAPTTATQTLPSTRSLHVPTRIRIGEPGCPPKDRR